MSSQRVSKRTRPVSSKASATSNNISSELLQ